MLELTAVLTCDRCNKTILQMENVGEIDEARQRLGESDWGCESEDGDDVCNECWAKWDEQHPVTAVEVTRASDAVPE